MPTRNAVSAMGLAIALPWMAVVIAHHASTTGLWAETARDAALLISLTGVLAVLAARVDDWVADLLGRGRID